MHSFTMTALDAILQNDQIMNLGWAGHIAGMGRFQIQLGKLAENS
jgi:hypothetical protein